MDLTTLLEYKTLLIGALGSMLVALLGGKGLRRLLLLPLKLIANKTQTKEDDLILEDVAKDLGLPENAAKQEETSDVDKRKE